MKNLTIENYSEKSVVVRGSDTFGCKEDLKELGGKYNARLRDGPGWIFSLSSKDQLEEYVKNDEVIKKKINIKFEGIEQDIKQDIKWEYSPLDSERLRRIDEKLDIIMKHLGILSTTCGNEEEAPTKSFLR